jgi:hypothetical protein
MYAPAPVPTERPHGTAKATLTFDNSPARADLYLFTDLAPAGQGWVYRGFAATGGEVAVHRLDHRPGDDNACKFPTCRAQWPAYTRAALAEAGYEAQFGSGTIAVKANPLHGTGEAFAQFDGPETFLAAIEDAFAEAGWTLIGTAGSWRVPAAWLAAAPAPGAEALAAAAGALVLDDAQMAELRAIAGADAAENTPMRRLADAAAALADAAMAVAAAG